MEIEEKKKRKRISFCIKCLAKLIDLFIYCSYTQTHIYPQTLHSFDSLFWFLFRNFDKANYAKQQATANTTQHINPINSTKRIHTFFDKTKDADEKLLRFFAKRFDRSVIRLHQRGCTKKPSGLKMGAERFS